MTKTSAHKLFVLQSLHQPASGPAILDVLESILQTIDLGLVSSRIERFDAGLELLKLPFLGSDLFRQHIVSVAEYSMISG